MVQDVKINKIFRCETVFSELNELLRSILPILEDAKTEKGFAFDYSIYNDYEGLVEILLNILFEKSNLKEVIKDSKTSLEVRDMGKVIHAVASYKDDEDLYEKFLNEFKKLFDLEMNNFSFLIPLNIELKTMQYEKDLESILKFFDLKKIEVSEAEIILDSMVEVDTSDSEDSFKEIEPSKEETLELLSDYSIIVNTEVNARSLYYADDEARFRVRSFLGLLSFVDNYLSQQHYHGRFDDYSINKMNYDLFFVIAFKKILSPTTLTLATFEKKAKESLEDGKFEFLKIVFANIGKISSPGLKNILKIAFYNYFEGTTEKNLNFSFLKFWIVTEEIMKSNSPKTELELNQIIKSLLPEKILKGRVDSLQKTRNHLVHTGKNASPSDRNLSKLIADLVLIDALRKMCYFDNKRQYDYYLLNINKKTRNRKELIKILELLNEEEI